MIGPSEQLTEPSETTAEPSVDSASARVWTTPSNASAYSNSKESRISSVFGNKKNKSRAVAYARVSSKRQAEEGVSLNAQVERLLAYAEFRGLELDPDDIYIDDGISAAIHLWSRPAGRKMRETIYQERVGHVLALKMDRLFRDVQDCLGSVDELRGIGVDIHILDQDGGILDTSTSMGRFFLTTIARHERAEKVEDHEPRLCRPSMNQSQTRLMFEPDPVERSTTQSITPVTNGQYWVIINDINDCESDTAFFTVNWISTSAAGIILTE